MSAPSLSPTKLAQAKLRARAARISRMRRRVAAASLAAFALAFGTVAVDGSMGTSTSVPRTQTTASATTASSSPSAVTTSQS
jgi:hypothetical protein